MPDRAGASQGAHSDEVGGFRAKAAACTDRSWRIPMIPATFQGALGQIAVIP